MIGQMALAGMMEVESCGEKRTESICSYTH